MSISAEKKKQIVSYILEKISLEDGDFIEKTSKSFAISIPTAYKYLNDLIGEGVVQKEGRGRYKLTKKESHFLFLRNKGELIDEDRIAEKSVLPLLKDITAEARNSWTYILGEMINNVIDHSEAERLEIDVFTDPVKTTVRISDDGIGIFEKIRRFYEFESKEEAAAELLKGKLTTDARHHSGEGIFFSSRLADDFVILSADTLFSHNLFDRDLWEEKIPRQMTDNDLSAAGTTLYITISNQTHRSSRDIFDEYADVEGGFTKTKLSVKAYFDGDPVSRSQAKRLCSRLERFKTVELDFADISWIGQGFADQLFRVYTAEHPEVEMILLNMNKDVDRMYQHVMKS